MTLTVYLLRHAAHDDVGAYLAGRLEGVKLGVEGRAQARRLAERLKGEKLELVLSSPRERTRETAEAISDASQISIPEVDDALDEVDFGSWSGLDFDTLNRDPEWRRWNECRSLARTPGGESMLDVQRRIMGVIERLSGSTRQRVALVSHSDVIKAAVSHVLGLSIDSWPRFDIEPASITRIVVGGWGAKVLTVNEPSP